ncbi:MAG TPA: response regulator [Terriglobales bacterium]|nr:response regulator [Terriglobales bacterium]
MRVSVAVTRGDIRIFPDLRQFRSVGINLSENIASEGKMTVLMLGKYLELGLYRAEYLRSHGYTVVFPESRQEAIKLVSRRGYELVILSYSLSDQDALDLRELIEQNCPRCPVITLTEQRWHDVKIDSDKIVLVSEGPEALLKAVQDVEQKKLRRVK